VKTEVITKFRIKAWEYERALEILEMIRNKKGE